MEIMQVGPALTVCKVRQLDPSLLSDELTFVGKTDEELSLVCATSRVPADCLAREDGWRALRICGVLDFSLVGILAPIAACLAEAGVGFFAVSTFNTDYILVKEKDLSRALDALRAVGYTII